MSTVVLATFTSCEDEQQFTNENTDARRIEVSVLPENLAKVRDYVPLYAVAAHRGSIFWTPEETEASWRWAREMGADYLESDMQATKDGIVLANHDENLKRTTNIQYVFSDYVPTTRKDFYRSFRNADGSQHFSEADIEAQYQRDVNDFRTFYTMSYYYAELLMLDAGSWFNNSSLEEARPAATTVSTATVKSFTATVSTFRPSRTRSPLPRVRSCAAMLMASASFPTASRTNTKA